MALIRPITAALLALVLSGCQATVTLKAPKPEQPPVAPTAAGEPAPVRAESSGPGPEAALPVDAPPTPAAPAAHPLPAPQTVHAGSSGGHSVKAPAAPKPPAVASAAAASDSGAEAGASPASPLPPPAAGLPVPGAAPARASAARPATFMDRVHSGLHTGTVGAAFGGVGGPIGLAAGGGAGFIAGFIAGRPLFGGGRLPRGGPESWDQQVADQQTWEEAVAARAEELDSGAQSRATGMTPAQPAAGASPAVAETAAAEGDPMESYEAWAARVLENAPDASPVDASPGDAPPAGEQAPAASAPAEPSEAHTTRAPAEPRVPEEAAAQASGDSL